MKYPTIALHLLILVCLAWLIGVFTLNVPDDSFREELTEEELIKSNFEEKNTESFEPTWLWVDFFYSFSRIHKDTHCVLSYIYKSTLTPATNVHKEHELIYLLDCVLRT